MPGILPTWLPWGPRRESWRCRRRARGRRRSRSRTCATGQKVLSALRPARQVVVMSELPRSPAGRSCVKKVQVRARRPPARPVAVAPSAEAVAEAVAGREIPSPLHCASPCRSALRTRASHVRGRGGRAELPPGGGQRPRGVAGARESMSEKVGAAPGHQRAERSHAQVDVGRLCWTRSATRSFPSPGLAETPASTQVGVTVPRRVGPAALRLARLAGLLGRRRGADGLLTHLIGCHWGLRRRSGTRKCLDRVLEILEVSKAR